MLQIAQQFNLRLQPLKFTSKKKTLSGNLIKKILFTAALVVSSLEEVLGINWIRFMMRSLGNYRIFDKNGKRQKNIEKPSNLIKGYRVYVRTKRDGERLNGKEDHQAFPEVHLVHQCLKD